MIVRCSSLLYVPDMLKNLPPFDAVIYIGDLNYRLDVSRDKASSHVFDDELTIVDLFQFTFICLVMRVNILKVRERFGLEDSSSNRSLHGT